MSYALGCDFIFFLSLFFLHTQGIFKFKNFFGDYLFKICFVYYYIFFSSPLSQQSCLVDISSICIYIFILFIVYIVIIINCYRYRSYNYFYCYINHY